MARVRTYKHGGFTWIGKYDKADPYLIKDRRKPDIISIIYQSKCNRKTLGELYPLTKKQLVNHYNKVMKRCGRQPIRSRR